MWALGYRIAVYMKIDTSYWLFSFFVVTATGMGVNWIYNSAKTGISDIGLNPEVGYRHVKRVCKAKSGQNNNCPEINLKWKRNNEFGRVVFHDMLNRKSFFKWICFSVVINWDSYLNLSQLGVFSILLFYSWFPLFILLIYVLFYMKVFRRLL